MKQFSSSKELVIDLIEHIKHDRKYNPSKYTKVSGTYVIEELERMIKHWK